MFAPLVCLKGKLRWNELDRIRPSLSDMTTTNNTTHHTRQVKPQPLFFIFELVEERS